MPFVCQKKHTKTTKSTKKKRIEKEKLKIFEEKQHFHKWGICTTCFAGIKYVMLLAPEPFKLAQQETKTRELRNAQSHYANVKKGDKLLIVKTDERKQCDIQLQQNQMCRETSMLWGKILPTE